MQVYIHGMQNISIQVMWNLLVKGLKNCCPSIFENDLKPGRPKTGPNALAHALAVMAEATDIFLRTPTLTASNFAALLT